MKLTISNKFLRMKMMKIFCNSILMKMSNKINNKKVNKKIKKNKKNRFN